MGGEAAARKKLEDAASKGDTPAFEELLQEDPHLLDRVSYACSNRSPLHTATLQGNFEVVEAMLNRNPQLARISDSQSLSPLHIAAAEGNDEITSKLLAVAPDVCWWRDSQGMNPVHVAAMNDHVTTLNMLLKPSLFPAMERVHRGQTVLHLCVKHGRFRALELLVNKLGELVYAKDDDGETILHLAVRCNQLEVVRLLVESNTVRKQTQNSTGKTPLDILSDSPLYTPHLSEMKRILMILSKRSMTKALPKLTSTTMVVAILIATMAFQAAVSPPGGVWQEDTSSHRAGNAVIASTHPRIYKHFIHANTIAFVSSLVTIFLITTQQPSGRIHFLLIVVYATWVSLASIAISYGASITVISPHTETRSLVPIIITVGIVTLSIIGFIMVSNIIRRLYLSWKRKTQLHEDLTVDSFIRRIFYFIFEVLELRQDFKLQSIFGLVVRGSTPSASSVLDNV